MALTPEGKVKNDIKKVLNNHGIWYFMPSANGFGKVGVPDFICSCGGMFLAVEAKAPGKKGNTTPNQKARIAEIIESGGCAVVIDDAAELDRMIIEWRT